jgi:hypothetical protein
VWDLRRARQRAWRQDVFLASASTPGQVYWYADALCYYPAHQHTQQGFDYRFCRQSGFYVCIRVNKPRMTRIERIDADFLGFIRQDPLYPRHPRFIHTFFAANKNALIPCAQSKTAPYGVHINVWRE